MGKTRLAQEAVADWISDIQAGELEGATWIGMLTPVEIAAEIDQYTGILRADLARHVPGAEQHPHCI